MAHSISPKNQEDNSQLPHQNVAYSRFRRLTKLKLKILFKYYELHILGIEKPDYSREELGNFFDRNVDHLSVVLNEMEREGILDSEHGGSRNKKRWITWDAFSHLDHKQTHKIPDQIKPIPYIYLPDIEDIRIKIPKEPHICGQFEKYVTISDPEIMLAAYLQTRNTPRQDIVQIKNLFKRSMIGPERSKNLIHRFIAYAKKFIIRSPRGYLSACIDKERKQIENVLHIFRGKPNLYLNEYAQF